MSARRQASARPSAVLLLVALVALGVAAGATADRSDLEARRARWHQKSPEERAVLRRRFEELSRLSPEVRQELHRRAQALEDELRTLQHAPPPWVRERLEGAGPGERDHVLRRCLEDHHRRRGERMRDRLPPEVLAQLEAAETDEERAAVYRELFRRGREEMFPRFVAGIGRRLELEPAEVERLQATPAPDQEQVIAALKRRLYVERGRPEEISEADWQAWQALSDAEFVQRVELYRGWWRRGPWRGPDGEADRDGRGWRERPDGEGPWSREGWRDGDRDGRREGGRRDGGGDGARRGDEEPWRGDGRRGPDRGPERGSGGAPPGDRDGPSDCEDAPPPL